MDHFIGGEKIYPPSAASKRKPRVVLGQVPLGLLAGLSPVFVTLVGFLLLACLVTGSDLSLNASVIHILPVVYWVFWICFSSVAVIVLIKALYKQWRFLTSSLPALLASLVFVSIFTTLIQTIPLSQVQLSQWPYRPPHVTEMPGQAINDETSNLSLTYLSARKSTDASSGLIYITVHIRMTNTSSNSVLTYSSSFFVKNTTTNKSTDAVDPEGIVPGYQGNSLLSATNNPIDPNATIEGDIAFSCFPDQNPDQFAWDPNFDSGQQSVKVYVWELTTK